MNPKPYTTLKRGSGMLETRSGGGCLSVFGTPFLLAGLFIMQIPLGVIPVEYERTPWMGLFLFIFGCIFAAVGGALVFGRSGLMLDRTRGRIVRWWGLLVPMKRTEYLLDTIGRVEMDFSPADSDSAESWPVRLAGESLPRPITVMNPPDFSEARRFAEELSRFLQKPLFDSSTGERVVRDSDHLDESYGDRVRRAGKSAMPVPPEPPEMRTRVERTGEGYVFLIAGRPLKWFHYIPAVLSLVVAGAVAYFFLPAILMLPLPEIIRYFALGIVGLFFIAGPVLSALLQVLRLKNQFERITVTKTFLRVEALKNGKRSTVEIPAAELEDLIAPTVQSAIEAVETPGMKKVPLGFTGTPRLPDGRPVPGFLLSLLKLAGSKGIIARSDRTIIEFAGGLEEAETQYLFALIRKTLAG